MEARRANVGVLGLEIFLNQHFLKCLENGRFARGVLRALGAKRLDGKTFETQSTGFVDFKFAELKAARPKINRQECSALSLASFATAKRAHFHCFVVAARADYGKLFKRSNQIAENVPPGRPIKHCTRRPILALFRWQA